MENSEHPSTNIMKELSDIKASLAVNTTETANIKVTVSEIKQEIRGMSDVFVTRREYVEATKISDNQISFIQKILWGLVSTLVAVFIAFLRYIKF